MRYDPQQRRSAEQGMKAVGRTATAAGMAAGMLLGCALSAPAAAESALPGLVPTFDVTVRGDADAPVRIGHFTPRVAAAQALQPSAVGGDAGAVLALGARWDEAVERALGFDAAIGISGAVLMDDLTRATEGVAFGATISALGVDLSGRYAQRDGAAADTLSFGAAVASGGWTLGGAVSLGVETSGEGAQPGASVEASYALTPGLRVGGVVAFGDDAQAGARNAGARDARARDAGAVSAGMSMRLDF